ncbi:MAG TPA: ABC transporter permease [Dongiaceae bacterium]|nr:ABC transporter permease [Dongiaceae bacterium]
MVRSDNRIGQYLMLAPLGVSAVLIVLLSLALVFALSFQRVDPIRLFTEFSWDGYAQNVTRPVFWLVLFRSLLISAAVTAVTLLLSYPVAYFIAFKASRHKALLLVLITAPFFTSYLLRIFAWKIILGFNGVVNSALKTVGLIDAPLQFLVYNPFSVVVALSHAYLAFAVLPIYVALERIDKSLLESASDLGARPFANFRQITLPLSLPGVVAAALLIFVPTVGDYVTPTLVGGPGGIMVGNLIQSQFGKANDWPAGSALSVTVILVVGLLLAGIAGGAKLAKRPA